MTYKVNRALGYEPWGVTNPWVFANYGQPQRHRGYVSPMVFQTHPPQLKNPHLGQAVDFLEEDRRRAARMEWIAIASLGVSLWSMWFFYQRMNSPTPNRRVRRNGKRGGRRVRRNPAWKVWTGPVEAREVASALYGLPGVRNVTAGTEHVYFEYDGDAEKELGHGAGVPAIVRAYLSKGPLPHQGAKLKYGPGYDWR